MSQSETLITVLTEPHIVINSDRTITVPSALTKIAVQFDHNIETVTFDCPRYWDDHDLSVMSVYINYQCPDGSYGSYPAANVVVDELDENTMHFDWTISRNVTNVNGAITFLVCIRKVDENGDEVNHWNSELCRDQVIVSEGLECSDVIVEKHSDVITYILQRLGLDFDGTVPEIPTKMSQLEDDIGYLPKEFEGNDMASIPATSTTTGRIAWDSKVVDGLEHSEGIYSIFDIDGLSAIRITGWQWSSQYGYYSYVLYDADGTPISKHLAAADNTGFVDLEVAVPENAKTIRINGKTPGYIPEVKYPTMVDAAAVIRVCATEHARFPKLMVLGDSITQLGTGSRGWLTYFLEQTKCELIANTAVIGARLHDRANTVYDGNPVYNGTDANANNVLGNQVQKIVNSGYEAPDLIMIAIGTNDGISITSTEINGAYYDSNGALIPLEQVDRKTCAGAYRYCLDTLHSLYPDAVICWCTPIHGHPQIRQPGAIMNYAESLRIATEFTGQILIDTIRCGINGANEKNGANGEYLVDGLHPNADGAKKIGYYNASKVLPLIQGRLINY